MTHTENVGKNRKKHPGKRFHIIFPAKFYKKILEYNAIFTIECNEKITLQETITMMLTIGDRVLTKKRENGTLKSYISDIRRVQAQGPQQPTQQQTLGGTTDGVQHIQEG